MVQCVSLVVVSQNREDALCNLIEILKVQNGIPFELIVVTNANKDRLIGALGDRPAKLIFSQTKNISYLRNLGIAKARSEIIAFCDDDCIPEPNWLVELAGPLKDSTVGSSTGPVIGRNGFSIQWGVTFTDRDGIDHVGNQVPTQLEIHAPQKDKFVRAQGTNCAFRKSDLDSLGGFDENFRYFLDETDLSKRLADLGMATAFVPTAKVQHMYLANATRLKNRAPHSLAAIGHSIRSFAAKHAPDPEVAIKKHYDDQLRRIRKAFDLGLIEPRDYKRLLCELQDLSEPAETKNNRYEEIGNGLFCETNNPLEGSVLVSTVFSRRKIRRRAAVRKSQGEIVTLLELTVSFRRHWRRTSNGYYVQTGGIWGRRDRKERVPSWLFSDCVLQAVGEIKDARNVKTVEMMRPFKWRIFKTQI